MKLDGVRVLDLSLFLPGPMLTQTMADHGAEVIKIEPPGEGEPSRHLGYRTADGVSVWFRNTHRGKKSVTLDLKSPDGVDAFLRLAETADVIVEAFRPGVVDRLGVGYAAAAKRNPRIVYASISAFGQTGPEATRPGHDISIEAMAGVLSLNTDRDGHPVNPHMQVADMAGALTALSAILMALLRREKTGRGDYIDISMQDATMAWVPNQVGSVFAEDRAPHVQSERTTGGAAFFSTYETADGRHICLGGVEHKFVRNLLTALERPDLIPLGAEPPGPAQEPLKRFLRDTFITRTQQEWEDWFASKDVCFAPVLTLHEAFHRPHVAAREMLVRDEAGNLHIGQPIKFQDEPGRFLTDLPAQGEHTKAILAELGTDTDDATLT